MQSSVAVAVAVAIGAAIGTSARWAVAAGAGVTPVWFALAA
jgi:hypothetical protein